MSHQLMRIIIAVAILLWAPLRAQAQLITFNFTGTVSFVPDTLSSGSIEFGQNVVGSFTFDSTVADSDATAVRGHYLNLIQVVVEIPAAGYNASASPGSLPGFIEVLNDSGNAGEVTLRDRYVASMTAPEQIVSGPPVAGAPLERLAIVLRDTNFLGEPPDAFSSDALPLLPPLLADFPTGRSFILGFEGLGELFVTLTSLNTSQVPVPVQIEALVEQVDALALGNTLNGGQANSLRQKLEHALVHVENDETGPAVNVLEAFIHQINAYVRSRRTTSVEADALKSAAQDIIAELNGTP